MAKVPESWVWQNLRGVMAGRWLAQRHESHSTGAGIPDVSFVMKTGDCETGWIELKVVDRLFDGRPNRIGHLTAAQEQRAVAQAELGIPVFLLIAVYESREWLWFHGHQIAAVQGKTGAELRGLAAFVGLDARHVSAQLIEKCSRSRRMNT